MNLRRLPGYVYHRKHLAIPVFVLCSLGYLLLRWGVVCTNLEAWRRVSAVCKSHENGHALGLLCNPLCAERGIHSLACESLHAGKEAVFSAHWETTKLVFKTLKSQPPEETESLHWLDGSGTKRYPTEDEFLAMIGDLARDKLNVSLNRAQLERLSRLRRQHRDLRDDERQREMENVWPLLQDNEYLLTILYEERDVFPQLIGTCGNFYAVEYARSIETPRSVALALSDSKPEWANRVKLAVMIMDLLEDLETGFAEPFHLCDLKIRHFGLPVGGRRLKFLDLDAVLPSSVLARVLKDGKLCAKHEDCDYFDCRSLCVEGHCRATVVNDNLQVVCEKIFLGWTLSGSIILPGLLMSSHTGSSLAVLLRQCANPSGDPTKLPRAKVPASLKSRLYNTLSEMDQSIV